MAFAAGSLLGGAFFHMLPASLESGLSPGSTALWMMAGFSPFMALEQWLRWHHCHRHATHCKEPLTYLILLGDALPSFLGGLGLAWAVSAAIDTTLLVAFAAGNFICIGASDLVPGWSRHRDAPVNPAAPRLLRGRRGRALGHPRAAG